MTTTRPPGTRSPLGLVPAAAPGPRKPAKRPDDRAVRIWADKRLRANPGTRELVLAMEHVLTCRPSADGKQLWDALREMLGNGRAGRSRARELTADDAPRYEPDRNRYWADRLPTHDTDPRGRCASSSGVSIPLDGDGIIQLRVERHRLPDGTYRDSAQILRLPPRALSWREFRDLLAAMRRADEARRDNEPETAEAQTERDGFLATIGQLQGALIAAAVRDAGYRRRLEQAAQEIVDARGEATAEAIRADVAEAQRDQAREIARDAIRVIDGEYGFSDRRFVLDLPEWTTPGLSAENYPEWLMGDTAGNNCRENADQQGEPA